MDSLSVDCSGTGGVRNVVTRNHDKMRSRGRPGGLRALRARPADTPRRGFNLLELMVVISVTLILTSIMMPAMARLREGAHRVVCSSNMRQMGMAFTDYGRSNKDRLPESAFDQNEQQEQMASFRGDGENQPIMRQWDGIGVLIHGGYCSAECAYCPSHHGHHGYEQYAALYNNPDPLVRIYTNYHFPGHLQYPDEDSTEPPRRKTLSDDIVLLTDGMRTRPDFNHVTGMNVLRSDGSVTWWEDQYRALFELIPVSENPTTNVFSQIWTLISENKNGGHSTGF